MRRMVLEEPAFGPRREPEDYLAWLRDQQRRAMSDPEGLAAEWLAANPGWDLADATGRVAGLSALDVDGMASSLRAGLRYRAAQLLPDLQLPFLVIAGTETRGSALDGEQRELLNRLGRSAFRQFDSGHAVHRDQFDDYCRTILDWAMPT
jgi:pimeloyl-ACP methyl ester carboxylesterase